MIYGYSIKPKLPISTTDFPDLSVSGISTGIPLSVRKCCNLVAFLPGILSLRQMFPLVAIEFSAQIFTSFSCSQLHPKQQPQHMRSLPHSLMDAMRYKIIVSPFPPRLEVFLFERRFAH